MLRLAFLALLSAITVAAATVPRLAFEQIVADAGQIVHGRILDSSTSSSGNFIWTHYRVQVTDPIKGTTATQITVSEPGGTLNGVTMALSGAVAFAPGEEVVLFLYQTPIGLWRTVGYWQGKFDVTSVAGAKQVRLSTPTADAMETAKPAGTRAATAFDRMSLDQFKQEIRRQVRR
jgi:hypothetical protein